MLLDARFRRYIEGLFPVPLDYDTLVTETGTDPGEPRLVIKYYKDEKLIYYLDYDLEHSFTSVPAPAPGGLENGGEKQ